MQLKSCLVWVGRLVDVAVEKQGQLGGGSLVEHPASCTKRKQNAVLTTRTKAQDEQFPSQGPFSKAMRE